MGDIPMCRQADAGDANGMSTTGIDRAGQRAGAADVRMRLTHAAIMTLARRTPYLEAELLGLSSVVGAGDVCVDVGAAAGIYTAALARLVGPTGQVHSIEPLSIAHPAWRWILRISGCPNVREYQLALGTEPGTGVMSVPRGRWMPVTGRSFLAAGSTGLGSNAEFASSQDVPVSVDTFDGLMARIGVSRLNFIKIDVEGAELRVLHGAEASISEFRPAILAEIEARHTARYEYSPEDLVDWLRERGYSMFTWQDGWKETPTVRADQRNYLFRPATVAK